MNVEQQRRLERVEMVEMRMVRWMCGISLRERKTNDELWKMMEIEPVMDVNEEKQVEMVGSCVEEG